jgi:PHD/YefM family antitoxin component YafN of YafNO toxin-antitoxin module
MKVYAYSEAREKFATVLEEAEARRRGISIIARTEV